MRVCVPGVPFFLLLFYIVVPTGHSLCVKHVVFSIVPSVFTLCGFDRIRLVGKHLGEDQFIDGSHPSGLRGRLQCFGNGLGSPNGARDHEGVVRRPKGSDRGLTGSGWVGMGGKENIKVKQSRFASMLHLGVFLGCFGVVGENLSASHAAMSLCILPFMKVIVGWLLVDLCPCKFHRFFSFASAYLRFVIVMFGFSCFSPPHPRDSKRAFPALAHQSSSDPPRG